MRGLDPGGEYFATGIHFHAHEVAAGAGIGEFLAENGGVTGQRSFDCALPPKNRRAHEKQKSYEGGDRIAGEPEQEFVFQLTKNERAAGSDIDLPKLYCAADFFEDVLDQIEFADRHAATGDDEIALSEC